MRIDKDTLNPADYPDQDDSDESQDRGDTGLDEDETEDEQEAEEKPAPKKKASKKDEEPEESDEDEESEEEEDEEEAPEEKKTTMVALSVLKKAQSKRRDAEARVAELEKRLSQQEDSRSDRQKEQFEKLTARMDSLYEKVEEARATGDTKEAAKLQRELDDIRGRMTQAQATLHATKQALAHQNTVAYNALVAELETIDPRFDQDDDEYDEDLVERVAELTEAYEAKGATAPDALRKSLRMILGSDPFREKRRLDRQPEAKPPVKVEPRKTDVKANVKAKNKQPPEERDTGKERAGKIFGSKLSEEDFDALPKSKLKELRGDFV